MADNNKVKITGYAQKVFYNDGIEYRNFTPDLVGNQPFDNNELTSLFTNGNFALTTNTSGRVVYDYKSKDFSLFYNLNDITESKPGLDAIIKSNTLIGLNTDTTELSNFAYFGSSTEFIRVSLENIISKWPASIYITPLDVDTSQPTYNVQDYVYDSYHNSATFKINTNTIVNNYSVIYDQSGILLSNYDNQLRNLTVNYTEYTLMYNSTEYPLIGFTASTYVTNDYIYVSVEGNPFIGNTGQPQYETYHIKPNNIEIEKFFSVLPPFENNVLNRLTVPKYTSVYAYQMITDDGSIYDTTTELTWPTTDGYNLDFNTNEYVVFVQKLLDITNNKDETTSDLVVRFLTSDSISNFDTIPRCDGIVEETAGQKMTKTLRIYGREFDEVKKYIDGIAYSNNVSYDKKENTPDQMVKYLARVLGWGLTSSVLENDLLNSFLNLPEPSYSGYSRGLSPAEAEIEMWRRLILNSAWLWKSKGTRKAIEFLFKFIGAPEGLINLNEYIYAAKEVVDVDEFRTLLEVLNYNTDLSQYSLDDRGFPKPLEDTVDLYFQKGGLWYRETGGQNANTYINEGNNPHIGPYDGGAEYIHQFRSLIPNFTPTVITSTTVTTHSYELFTNYNNGLVNGYSGNTYVDVETFSGVSLEDCFLFEGEIINDPHPTSEVTECGCDIPSDDLSLYIDVKRSDRLEHELLNECESRITGYTFVNSSIDEFYSEPFIYVWDYLQYNIDGSTSQTPYISEFISPRCCSALVNGSSYLHDTYNINPDNGKPILENSGYVCCKPRPVNTDPGPNGCGCYLACQWRLAGPLLGYMYTYNDAKYLKFVTPKNNWGVDGEPEFRIGVKSDSCYCPLNWTTREQILDPYTNEIVYGCKINKSGVDQLSVTQLNQTYGTENSPLYQLFYQKSIGEVGCQTQLPSVECNLSVSIGTKWFNRHKNGNFIVSAPTITGGQAAYTYNWQIITQTGRYSNYVFINSPLSASPIIGPINQQLIGGGTLTMKVTVTDANGCTSYTTKTISNISPSNQNNANE